MIACEADAANFEDAYDSPGYADAELRACRALRGQIPLYIKGEFGASQIRDRLTRCSTLAEFQDVLEAFQLTIGSADTPVREWTADAPSAA
jgi:hypothetical protein